MNQHHPTPLAWSLILPALVAMATACAAPRAVTQSGKVLSRNSIRAGYNMGANISTSTTGAIVDGLEKSADEFVDNPENEFDPETTGALTKALVAYAVDPLGATSELYARYGVYDRIDVGLKLAGPAKAADLRFQFLGPVGKQEDTASSAVYANIAIQYATQTYEFPGFLDKLASVLNAEFTRQDILVPITFSRGFGPNEKYGAVSGGVVYSYTAMEYGFGPDQLFLDVTDTEGTAVEGFRTKKGFHSFGGFFNIKGGYKYAYVVASLAVYYQDYGSFKMLEDTSVELAGFSIIPTLGIEVNYDF